MKGKTRIAPTPSGYLHRGNLFSFALTWLFARKEQLDILLRIDDLDQARYRPAYAEDIFRSLEALDLEFQEGPQNVSDLEKHWSQKHRLPLYQQALKSLRDRDLIFACTCSRKVIATLSPRGLYLGSCLNKNLAFDDPNTAWRWKRNQGRISLVGWFQENRKASLSPQMYHQVLKSKEGYPAYQLSSVVDDVHFGISHIVRGEDLWDSSLCQSLLAKDLALEDFNRISFHHHEILKQKGEKLSKSKDAPAAEIYQNPQGIKALCGDLADYLGMKSKAENLTQLYLDWRENEGKATKS